MPLSSRYRPRRLRRNQVPLHSAGINAELLHEGRTLPHGIVWDLTWAGACILFNTKQPLPGVKNASCCSIPQSAWGK